MAAAAILVQWAILLIALHPHLASCNPKDEVSQFCGSGRLFENRCYWPEESATQWMYARFLCSKNRADIAVITSQEQQDWVRSMLPDRNLWIGLRKTFPEGHWQWLDDTPLNYTNWKAGYPSNSSDNSCAFLSGSDGTWQDAPCHLEKSYICAETPKTPVCDRRGLYFRDRCYWFYQGSLASGRFDCDRYQNGAEPVIIRDGELNAFLSKVMYPTMRLALQRPRFGKQPYTWADGSKMTFQNWARGQVPRSRYDCAFLEYGTGYWRQDTCGYSNTHNFVCALPTCKEDLEGSGPDLCVEEKQICSCVTGGYCLEHRRCHCMKMFHGMVCDKARFSVELRTRSHVDEGGTIELECHVNIPKSDYSLQMQFVGADGRAVEGALPVDRTVANLTTAETGYYEFVIRNVTTEDTGTYLCVVSTEAASEPITRSHSAHVKVRETLVTEKPHHKGGKNKKHNQQPAKVSANAAGLTGGVVTLAVCCVLLVFALVLVVVVAKRRSGWPFIGMGRTQRL